MHDYSREALNFFESSPERNSKPPEFKITSVEFYNLMELPWDGRKMFGYHSDYYHPEYIIKTLSQTNVHGVKRVIVGRADQIKVSTIFCDLEATKYGDKIFEGLMNGRVIKLKNGTTYIRSTIISTTDSEGIAPLEIEIIVSREGVIVSSYPIYKS